MIAPAAKEKVRCIIKYLKDSVRWGAVSAWVVKENYSCFIVPIGI